MKKLLVLLFSLFFLSSPSVFADDISDFQIEGISIGDSLLDYMTKDEILEEIELNKDYYYYLNEPNKYAEIYLWKEFPTYDFVSVFIKNNATNQYLTNKNEKYTILSIRGLINYIEDFDSCLAKKDEIVSELSKVFINAQKTEHVGKHGADTSGNSIVDVVDFKYASGDEASIYCDNFEETLRIKNNWTEGLTVSIKRKEINEWLSDWK